MPELILEGTVVAVAADRGHHFSKPLRPSITLIEGHGWRGDCSRWPDRTTSISRQMAVDASRSIRQGGNELAATIPASASLPWITARREAAAAAIAWADKPLSAKPPFQSLSKSATEMDLPRRPQF
jgi:hypothetical protein